MSSGSMTATAFSLTACWAHWIAPADVAPVSQSVIWNSCPLMPPCWLMYSWNFWSVYAGSLKSDCGLNARNLIGARLGFTFCVPASALLVSTAVGSAVATTSAVPRMRLIRLAVGGNLPAAIDPPPVKEEALDAGDARPHHRSGCPASRSPSVPQRLTRSLGHPLGAPFPEAAP